MTKLISVFILTFSILTTYAQSDISQYLQTHNYSFTLDKGFDEPTADSLKQKLENSKLILLGEGGSHFLKFYEPLRFVWVKFLSENFGMKNFFMEFGHSSDILCNKFLQTGDTSFLPRARFTAIKTFWKRLYSYNATQPKSKQVKSFGIDFERTHSYGKALKSLLPNTDPTEKIKETIDLIKNSNDTLNDCDYVVALNSKLKGAINNNSSDFQKYFSTNFSDVKQIVFNNGSCKNAQRDRNKNMAENFLSFDSKENDKIYYGQLGMAHTILSNKNTASYLNENPKFSNKVSVINTYCYNCSTPEEQVSNWQVHKIEKDILEYFLPFCDSDFTLFDLSDNIELTKKYRAYGQFLIIAKNQN
jgi:hypothetical protein